MGLIYSVSCRDCKVTRDLDKFYAARKISTRQDAIKLAEEISKSEGWVFRSALLVSFMSEHEGHNCVFFNEDSSDGVVQELDPFYGGTKEDTDFWKTNKKCWKCDKPAVRNCSVASSLVCGKPECDEHSHNDTHYR